MNTKRNVEDLPPNLNYIIMSAWQAHDAEPERLAYVRHAIVRAAAEIGKQMKEQA